MRDEVPRADADGLTRVVVLGDSVTFGWGVSADDAYPNVLERLLNQSQPDTPHHFDVLNFGVSGYASPDEAIVFREKALRWNPTLAIVGYYLNDPEIEPVQLLHAYFAEPSWWQYSNFLRLLALRKQNWSVARLGGGNYYRYLHADAERWTSVVEAFGEIARVARSRHIDVALVIFPEIPGDSWADYPYLDLHSQVADAARAEGFTVVDLYEAFSAHEPLDLRVHPRDSHPNRLGHELAAWEIHRKLQSDGAGLPRRRGG
jgi:hypothetical protein